MRAVAAPPDPNVVAGSIVMMASVNQLAAAEAAAISPSAGRVRPTRNARPLADPPSAAIMVLILTVASTAAASRVAPAPLAAIAAQGSCAGEACVPSARRRSTARYRGRRKAPPCHVP